MRGIGVPGVVVCALLALCAPAAAAARDDGLVPARGDLPGYRAAGHGAALGRAAFAATLPGSVRHAPAVGARFRDGGRTVTFGVVTAARAGAALKALRHGRRTVALGSGVHGLLRQRARHHRTDVSIAFALGHELGAVRLQARTALPRALAVARAQSLVLRLQRVGALTALDRTLAGIRGDGSFNAQVALQAFALAYGPLPGVKTVSGTSGAEFHATMAAAMVYRVWDQLTAAQRAAVDQYLGVAPPTSTASIKPADHVAEQVLTPDAAYTAIAQGDISVYRGLIPGLPAITVKAFRASDAIKSEKFGDAAADAMPADAAGQFVLGPMAYCRIRVPPVGQALGDAVLKVVLAHEAFHCVEFALNPTGWPSTGDWRIEGLADWAAQKVIFGSGPYADSLRKYYMTPTQPLFSRAYDATGFWGHADEVGGSGSLFAKVPAIMNAPSNAAAYAAAGAAGQSFQTTWASAVWRSNAGPAWNQTDPVAIPTSGAGTDALVIDDDASLRSDPYAMAEYGVPADPDRPIVEVSAAVGTVRAGTGTEDFGVVGNSQFFCAGVCTCPPNTTSKLPDLQHFSKVLRLAQTAGDDLGLASVRYHSLDDYCTPTFSTGILVYEGEKIVARFKSGTCSAGAGGFRATAHSGAWKLDVRIKAFGGYSKRYELSHSDDPSFTIDGPGGPYSNRYPSPDDTPAMGAITFYPGGGKMLLGYEYTWNAGGSNAILPVGKMTCVKPRKGHSTARSARPGR